MKKNKNNNVNNDVKNTEKKSRFSWGDFGRKIWGFLFVFLIVCALVLVGVGIYTTFNNNTPIAMAKNATIGMGTVTMPAPTGQYGNTWESVTWAINGGDSVTDVSNLWSDGTNIYYSHLGTQYVLDTATSTWETQTWSGLTRFLGSEIWSDGTNIYYSSDDSQYVLNTATSTWTAKTWTGLSSFSGNNVWSDGTNIYYSSGYDDHYVLDTATSTWETQTWMGLSDFLGSEIWSDGTNIYCSTRGEQSVLNTETLIWRAKTWTGLSDFFGYYVCTDGTNIYYSLGDSQYVLDTATSTWTAKTWTGLSSFSGNNVWSDGTNIYYSLDDSQYVLNTDTSGYTITYNCTNCTSSESNPTTIQKGDTGELYATFTTSGIYAFDIQTDKSLNSYSGVKFATITETRDNTQTMTIAFQPNGDENIEINIIAYQNTDVDVLVRGSPDITNINETGLSVNYAWIDYNGTLTAICYAESGYVFTGTRDDIKLYYLDISDYESPEPSATEYNYAHNEYNISFVDGYKSTIVFTMYNVTENLYLIPNSTANFITYSYIDNSNEYVSRRQSLSLSIDDTTTWNDLLNNSILPAIKELGGMSPNMSLLGWYLVENGEKSVLNVNNTVISEQTIIAQYSLFADDYNTVYGQISGHYFDIGYDNGEEDGYKDGYQKGIEAADNRVNPNSVNYRAGYAAGQTAGDWIINTPKSLFESVVQILNIDIFGVGITVGNIFGVVVVLGVVFFILKFARGA